jgi:hypothetical protein
MPSFICSCTLVGDVAALELDDLQLNQRSGTFRFGKGAKERWTTITAFRTASITNVS